MASLGFVYDGVHRIDHWFLGHKCTINQVLTKWRQNYWDHSRVHKCFPPRLGWYLKSLFPFFSKASIYSEYALLVEISSLLQTWKFSGQLRGLRNKAVFRGKRLGIGEGADRPRQTTLHNALSSLFHMIPYNLVLSCQAMHSRTSWF